MSLRLLQIEPLVEGPVPDAVRALIEDAETRIDAFLSRHREDGIPEFVPSDARLAWRALRTLEGTIGRPARICEWGSGFGTFVGIAALLGHEAWGIELEPRLVREARRLLADHGIEAPIVEGSFLPDAYVEPDAIDDPDFLTVLPGTAAYEAMELDPDDFDLFFAFPWPGSEGMYHDLFDRYASAGSLLLTYHGLEGMCLHRKEGASRESLEDEVREPDPFEEDEP
jgi:hypothetical protein